MCGIAGIISTQEASSIVHKMLARIAHRGPDGQGIEVARVGKRVATFGHRRLSIVDLETGGQPMRDAGLEGAPRPRALITFNGEIYDHEKTREALKREGARFVTRSDTESLVSGFASWGESVVPRLSGMFAFVTFDLRTGEVLLARDRSGIKPLYWAHLDEAHWPGGGIAFASELDAMLEVPGIERRVSAHGLQSFLFSDYAHPPYTLIEGVQKLAPGELMWLRGNGQLDGPRAYVTPQMYEPGSTPPTSRELLETLEEAVASQLMSDVPLGVFLSGGIDSSLVATLASKRAKTTLKAFSIGFEEATFDESLYAKQVAQKLGLEHIEARLSSQAMLDVIDKVLDQLDEPLGDHSIVPTYFLCELASKHVKVALGGDGADELFGGYPTYVAHAREAKLGGALVSRAQRLFGEKRIRDLLERIPSSNAYQALDWKVKRFVGRWDDNDIRRHLRWMSTLDVSETERALHPSMRAKLNGSEPATLAAHYPFAGDVLSVTTALDFATYMPGSVLTKVDRASMAHGLEARPPFLDENVLALARRIPPKDKVRGKVTKVLLKQAARGVLPSEILDRKKHGFSVPLAAWLRGPLLPKLDAILADSPAWGVLNQDVFQSYRNSHLAMRGDHAKGLWALIVLDRWMRSRRVA